MSEFIYISSYVSDEGSSQPLKTDIKHLVQEIQIYESINYKTLSGSIILADANQLLERALTGNELLEFSLHSPQFTLEDSVSKGYDFTEESGHPMWISKVSKISSPNPGVKVYALDFYSKERIKDSQRKLCKAFEGPIHESVRTVLRYHLKSEKNFHYERTVPNVKYVIPKKSPIDTISFLAKESISEKFTASGFYFYETSDGFHFKSLESMVSTETGQAKSPQLNYSDAPKTDSGTTYNDKGIAGNMSKVYEFKVINRFDTLNNIKSGTYASRLVTYNGFTKEFRDVDFNYPYEFEQGNHMGQLGSEKLTAENSIMPLYNYEEGKMMSDFPDSKYMFTTSTSGLHDHRVDKVDDSGRFVYKQGTYNPIKEKTIEPIETADIEQTLQKSISQKTAFNSFVIELQVPGNTAITAGSVISFSTTTGVLDGDTKPKLDPYLSGTYLITEVRHIIQTTGSNPMHAMTLICAKDSVGKKYTVNDINVFDNTGENTGKDFNQYEIDESTNWFGSITDGLGITIKK